MVDQATKNLSRALVGTAGAKLASDAEAMLNNAGMGPAELIYNAAYMRQLGAGTNLKAS